MVIVWMLLHLTCESQSARLFECKVWINAMPIVDETSVEVDRAATLKDNDHVAFEATAAHTAHESVPIRRPHPEAYQGMLTLQNCAS